MNHDRIAAIYPLTSSQGGILFHTLDAGAANAYHVQMQCDLAGELEPRLFVRAWQMMFDRHAVLRTQFVWQQRSDPVQVVLRDVKVPCDILDWRAEPEESRGAKLTALLAEDRRRGFACESAPQFRLHLVRCADARWQCLISFHHLILDGWSVGILLDEVFAAYEALRHDAAVVLPPVPPFRDYVIWLSKMDRAAAECYWRRQLAGITAATPLPLAPAANHEDDVARTGPAACQFELDPATAAALAQCARRLRVTLATLMQGSWALLLARYSGHAEVVFGTTVAGRPPEFDGIERMVGLFIKTVPVRVAVPPSARVDDWLRVLQAEQAARQPHDHAPLSAIQGWSDVPRGAALFDTLQVFENYPLPAALHDGPRALRLAGARSYEQSNYGLTFVASRGSALSFELSYDPTRFAAAAVARLGKHLATLMRGIAADPGQRLGDLPLLGPAERTVLIERWNATSRPYPAGCCIHALFEEMAAQEPDRAALRTTETQVTYRELNKRANRLAHALRGHGVRLETRIVVCLERGIDSIVALLAILKAGGAYVPLDPASPAPRLAAMLKDSNPLLILTNTKMAHVLPGAPAHRIVRLDTEVDLIARQSDADPAACAHSDSLAYVLYTSGSTGEPKGVAVAHRAVVRLVKGVEYVALGPDETVLQFAPLSFDASTFEIWGALLNGGTLAIFPPELPSLEELGCFIREQSVTTAWLTAGLFEQMVSERGTDLAGLRQLIAGGDTLRPIVVARAVQLLTAGYLVNGYGPTESTTFACCHQVPCNARADEAVPIGLPIANTRAYVLDDSLEPVPVGGNGELYLGGDGLARGYLNDPALTAARFLPDPFASIAGGRLYRTGDLVRQRADGPIEFLGRRDHQVKIRGYRVEPGEIEAALATHPTVREAVVLALPDSSGERCLVGCLVPATDAGVPDGDRDLRRHLRASLPAYMVPSAFVRLDRLPLTPNGKLDRAALAALAATAGRGAGSDDHMPPRTPMEELVASVWAEVLRIERVGRQDDFFALGGHSLLATRVLARLRGLLGRSVAMRTLFEAPTLAGLAAALDSPFQGESEPPPLVAQSTSADQPQPLSFTQQWMWLLEQYEPGNPGYIIPLILRLDGALSVSGLAAALSAVVGRHAVLRTRIVAGSAGPVQMVTPVALLDLPVTDLSAFAPGAREAAVAAAQLAEAMTPFDLSVGPILRARLLRLEAEAHILLLTVHHIAFDDWSLGVLFRELAVLYPAYANGTQPVLAAPSLSYTDYARWQRGWLDGPTLATALGAWRSRLAGAPPVLDLPTDRPRPAALTGTGALLPLRLPATLVTELRQLSRREGVTLFMTLLAGFQIVLSRWSGQADIVVGVPVAGRTEAALEDLIGCFINTLVMRAELPGGLTVRQALARVREASLAGYAHQALPFMRLVEALAPARDASHTPLVQVGFDLHNTPAPELRLGALQVTPQAPVHRGAKLDLFLILEETPAGELVGGLEYRPALFEAATVSRLAGHLETVLRGMAAAPQTRLAALPLLTAAEREELLVTRNATAVAYPVACVHELISAQAARTPTAPAVIAADAELSFAQLEARANQLAWHLQALGVRRQTRVAVCLDRSAALAVALLGILKAGGAFVPLDPSFPSDRIGYVLDDSAATVLLTQASQLDHLPRRDGLAVLSLDADWPVIASHPTAPPPCPAGPDDLCYLIYTSGSTGRPKGVLIAHRPFVNYLAWCIEAYRAASGRGAPVESTIAADAIFPSLFAPLLVGTTVVMVPESPALEALAQILRTEGGFSLMKITPSQLEVLNQQVKEDDPRGWVGTMVIGAEALRGDIVTFWRDKAPDTVLLNEYGPTETVVGCSIFRLPQTGALTGAVPIGLPIANTEFYVLDGELQPVPVGVPGELYIGGDGLAWGYHNRPSLTASSFIPHPYSTVPGVRLYKTGDVVRYLSAREPNIEFLGRRDHQVKIRGYRVELGEVEAVLAAHPATREVVVVARDDSPVGQQLVAYIVPREVPPSADVWRCYVQERLPAYMVPSSFVQLPALPLLTNGKLDRHALPPPDAQGHSRAGEPMAARTPLERTLVEIWEEILGVTHVGIDDNFFELGGHSLLATQAVARLRERAKVHVPLRAFFDAPTPAGVAEAVESMRWVAANSDERSRTASHNREQGLI